MFYKLDRSGSTTVTFSKYMTLLCSSGHLGPSAIKNLFVLGHSINCGLESWSGMAPSQWSDKKIKKSLEFKYSPS